MNQAQRLARAVGWLRSVRWALWGELAARLATPFAVIVLPFVVLVRGAVALYSSAHWPSSLALLGSGAAMVGVVALYGAIATRRLTGRARFGWIARWVALPLVLGFVVHGLVFLDRTHAQDGTIRAEYRDTHPLLRVALATLELADDHFVITDLSRSAADYSRMGLPVVAGTLHAPQADGWVHAVDIHTRGRVFFVNWLVEGYFRAMGFRTRRHVGTRDHLHVELPLN